MVGLVKNVIKSVWIIVIFALIIPLVMCVMVDSMADIVNIDVQKIVHHVPGMEQRATIVVLINYLVNYVLVILTNV